MSVSLRRRPSLRKRRKLALSSSFCAVLVILVIYYTHGWSAAGTWTTATQLSPVSSNPLLQEHASFWRSFYHIILNNDPQCKKFPDIVVPEKLDIAYEDDHFHNRPDVLWIDDADVQRLKTAHQNFLNDIQTSRARLVFNKGSSGIIVTVSDTQIPILLIQLRMLRAANSLLPVEVFLSQPTPYTEHICNHILPIFDATCVYYSHIFTAAGTGVEVASYQYKVLAILFSSFDNVLLLDSDAWPINNPDQLFMYPPFTDSGLILWPDFWYASESPYFFSIAKIDDPPTLHTKPSVESGELMYSKSKHGTSILLAAYYNYYGPDYYYPLLSQGAPGQGDKETFGSAALALREDYYWVKTKVNAIGRMDSSGRWLGSAMVQYDPIVDFQNADASHPHNVAVSGGLESRPERQKGIPPKQPTPSKTVNKPLFIHANFPKFDPRTIFDNHDMGSGIHTSPARDSNGTYVRCWDMTAESAVERFGYDVERRFWTVIQEVACVDLVGQDNLSRKTKELEVCRNVQKYVKDIFGDPNGP